MTSCKRGRKIRSGAWGGLQSRRDRNHSRPLAWAASTRASAATNMLLGRRLSNVVCAGVLFEALLRHAIEGERGDGALQAWGDHAPRAARATPAGEVFVFSPDHVSIHRPSLIVNANGTRARGGERKRVPERAGKLPTAPRRTQCPTEALRSKVTKVLRPVGQGPSGRSH